MSLLKLFLLWFFLSSLKAHSVTQSFSRVGRYYDQVSNAHLGVTVDFGGFDHYLGLLEKVLAQLTSDKKGIFDSSAVVARLGAVVKEVRQRHDQYQAFFSGTPISRSKRQLGAVLGIGLSLAALYDVEDLRGTVGKLQSRQNDLVRLLGCVTNDTAKLTKNFNRLHSAMVQLETVDAKMSHILEVESAVLEISALAGKLFDGLRGLLHGQLSFELVYDKDVKEQFHALREAAFGAGFGTVFSSYTQIFQLPASFLAENGVVHVVVDVPLVPLQEFQEYDLLSFNSVPFLLGQHLVQVRPPTDLLAVNQDKSRFMEIPHAKIRDCLTIGRSVLCHYKNVIISGSAQSCLRALYEGNAEVIFRHCPLTFVKTDFVLERINATAFFSFSNQTIPGSVTCDGERTQISFHGFHVHNLEPGCVIFAGGFTFVAAFDPVIRIPNVLTTFSSPDDVVEHFSNFSARIKSALVHFDHVDYNALLEGGEELGKMVPWIPTSNHFWWISGSVTGMAAFCGLGALLLRRRCLSWIVERVFPGGAEWMATPEGRPLSKEGLERSSRAIQCHLSPPPSHRPDVETASWNRIRGVAISPPPSRSASESELSYGGGFGRGCLGAGERRPGTVLVEASRVPLLQGGAPYEDEED